VEDLADARGLRGLFEEIAQARGGRLEVFQKKRIDGGEAGGELRRMQVPPLVETVFERAADVLELEFPASIDGGAILVDLTRGERRTVFRCAVRRDRENIQRAVGDADSRVGESDLHHLAREVRPGM